MSTNIIDVNFKKQNILAKDPIYSIENAGIDLIAIHRNITDKYIEYDTGLVFEIPIGYVGLLMPRSSSTDKDQMLKNCVGVIDSSYRGTIKARYTHAFLTDKKNLPVEAQNIYRLGDKCCQLVIIPQPQLNLKEVKEVSETIRNEKGFGSSGN